MAPSESHLHCPERIFQEHASSQSVFTGNKDSKFRCLYTEFFSRYSFGDKPVIFLNVTLKDVFELNPTSKQIVMMLRSGLSTSNRMASRTRKVFT